MTLSPRFLRGFHFRALFALAGLGTLACSDDSSTGGGGGSTMPAAGASSAGSGGGGMAGSSGGTGGSTAGSDDGSNPASAGCPEAAFFCEDFEGLAVGPAASTATWVPDPRGPGVSVDDAVARGARSLHLRAAGGDNARMFPRSFSPPAEGFFGRFYAYVEEFPSAPEFAHFVMVEAFGGEGDRPRPIGGQLIGGQALWGTGSDGGPSGDWTRWDPSAPAEAGRWLCLEWEMRPADNVMNVWVDDEAQSALSVSTNDHDGQGEFRFPEFTQMWIGWWLFQGGTTPAEFNVWIDDVALSPERIGC